MMLQYESKEIGRMTKTTAEKLKILAQAALL
jgi:hypothetical protein